MIYQDLPQLKRDYPKSYNSFLANAKVQIYFGVADPETADHVCKVLGQSTIDVQGTSTQQSFGVGRGTSDQPGGGGSTTYTSTVTTGQTLNSQQRNLMNADELMRCGNDYAIVFLPNTGCPPIIARKLLYYDDPLFQAKPTLAPLLYQAVCGSLPLGLGRIVAKLIWPKAASNDYSLMPFISSRPALAVWTVSATLGFAALMYAPKGNPVALQASAPQRTARVAANQPSQPAIKPPQQVKPAGMTAEQFGALRDQLVAALLKGPQFSGTAYESGVGESPVNVRIAWDDETKRAVGEIKFLAFQKSSGVQGIIVEDKANPGQVVLSLNAVSGNGGTFNLKATSSGQQLTGTYNCNGAGTLTLNPKLSEGMTAGRFGVLRDELVAALLRGPQFSGTAYEEGVGESPVNVRIAWDNESKRAVGEIKFLAFQKSSGVQGIIVEDKANPGQVILSLNAVSGNSGNFILKAASAGQQLAGTYNCNGSGTLTLNPVQPTLAAYRPQSPTSNPQVTPAVPQATAIPLAVEPAPQPTNTPQITTPLSQGTAVPATAGIPPAIPIASRQAPLGVAPNIPISIVTLEDFDAANSVGQSITVQTSDPFPLNNGKIIPAGTKGLIQVVQNNGIIGLRLTIIMLPDNIVPVHTDTIDLHIKPRAGLITQRGSTFSLDPGAIFQKSGKISKMSRYKFTTTP